MKKHTAHIDTNDDPLTELYDLASALRFMEDAFDGHDQSERQVRAAGAAYLSRIMGVRASAIATTLWDTEHSQLRCHQNDPAGSAPAHQNGLAPRAQGSPSSQPLEPPLTRGRKTS